jgi:hypothetical protein
MEDVPPLLQVVQGVSFERSGEGLAGGVELDVPRLRDADEVHDLHLVAVAGTGVIVIKFLSLFS